jgi:aminopeptidase C
MNDEGEDVDNRGGPGETFAIDKSLGKKAGNDGFLVYIRNLFEETILIFGTNGWRAILEKSLDEWIFGICGEF